MLAFYNRLGGLISRYRRWLILLLLLNVSGFITLLVTSDGRYDNYAMRFAVAALWLLGALAVGSYFPLDPNTFTPINSTFTRRWQTRLRWLLCWAVMLTASATAALLLLASIRLLNAS